MTQTIRDHDKRRVLALYRANRAGGDTPYEAIVTAADVFAHLSVRHTMNLRQIAALEDATASTAALNYMDAILARQGRLSFWVFGRISPTRFAVARFAAGDGDGDPADLPRATTVRTISGVL